MNLNKCRFCATSLGAFVFHTYSFLMGQGLRDRSSVWLEEVLGWLTAELEYGCPLVEHGSGQFFNFVIYFKTNT